MSAAAVAAPTTAVTAAMATGVSAVPSMSAARTTTAAAWTAAAIAVSATVSTVTGRAHRFVEGHRNVPKRRDRVGPSHSTSCLPQTGGLGAVHDFRLKCGGTSSRPRTGLRRLRGTVTPLPASFMSDARPFEGGRKCSAGPENMGALPMDAPSATSPDPIGPGAAMSARTAPP